MRRTDYGLAAVTAGVLTALLVVAALRPTPDRRNVIVALYVVAGTLEAVGVATIGLGLFGRRRRAPTQGERRLTAAGIGFGALLLGVILSTVANVLLATA